MGCTGRVRRMVCMGCTRHGERSSFHLWVQGRRGMGQGQPTGQSCGECCEPGLQLQQWSRQRCRPATHLLVQLRGRGEGVFGKERGEPGAQGRGEGEGKWRGGGGGGGEREGREEGRPTRPPDPRDAWWTKGLRGQPGALRREFGRHWGSANSLTLR